MEGGGWMIILLEEESRNEISWELETSGGESKRSSVNEEISSYTVVTTFSPSTNNPIAYNPTKPFIKTELPLF